MKIKYYSFSFNLTKDKAYFYQKSLCYHQRERSSFLFNEWKTSFVFLMQNFMKFQIIRTSLRKNKSRNETSQLSDVSPDEFLRRNFLKKIIRRPSWMDDIFNFVWNIEFYQDLTPDNIYFKINIATIILNLAYLCLGRWKLMWFSHGRKYVNFYLKFNFSKWNLQNFNYFETIDFHHHIWYFDSKYAIFILKYMLSGVKSW